MESAYAIDMLPKLSNCLVHDTRIPFGKEAEVVDSRAPVYVARGKARSLNIMQPLHSFCDELAIALVTVGQPDIPHNEGAGVKVGLGDRESAGDARDVYESGWIDGEDPGHPVLRQCFGDGYIRAVLAQATIGPSGDLWRAIPRLYLGMGLRSRGEGAAGH